MDARSKGLIATIAAVVLCGCPGILLCITGAGFALGVPVTTELNGVSSTNQVPVWLALTLLCIAVILILIPLLVGFLTLRSKPAPANLSEPVPPPS